MQKYFTVPVTFTSAGQIIVMADNVEQAKKIVKDNFDFYPFIEIYKDRMEIDEIPDWEMGRIDYKILKPRLIKNKK